MSTITSPAGTIQFCALSHLVRRKPDDTEVSVHTVRLEFDGSTAAGKAFKKQVEDVNAGLIGVKHASKPGNFTVQASTKFEVTVYDSEANQLEKCDIPRVTSGTAIMGVQPYTKNALGGSLNLKEVILLNYEELEAQGESETERQARMAAAIAAALK